MSQEIENIQSNFYQVRIKCSNCGVSTVVSIPKKTLVSQSPCPNCRCACLSVVHSDHGYRKDWEILMRDDNNKHLCSEHQLGGALINDRYNTDDIRPFKAVNELDPIKNNEQDGLRPIKKS